MPEITQSINIAKYNSKLILASQSSEFQVTLVRFASLRLIISKNQDGRLMHSLSFLSSSHQTKWNMTIVHKQNLFFLKADE